jgi:metallo-beta-lactamase class B
MMRLPSPLLLTLALAACGTTGSLPSTRDATGNPGCAAGGGWNVPAPPRQVHGNTWYVGTCGLSAVLISSPEGHVLLDGATAEAAPLIAANIRALGFELADVRYILNSHEHHDHAGGIAQLAADSGAQVMAGAAAIPTLRRGASDRSDPQHLTLGPFPPVASATAVSDGQGLVLGAITVTAHATPGHAPGGTSWTWRSCARTDCLDIVYADSLTAISDEAYRYSAEAAHPGVLAGFRRSIDKVAALPCDILITTHPSASRFLERLDGQGLVDPSGCRAYADRARAGLEARLVAEQEGAAP